jgi:hypothetical protein
MVAEYACPVSHVGMTRKTARSIHTNAQIHSFGRQMALSVWSASETGHTIIICWNGGRCWGLVLHKCVVLGLCKCKGWKRFHVQPTADWFISVCQHDISGLEIQPLPIIVVVEVLMTCVSNVCSVRVCGYSKFLQSMTTLPTILFLAACMDSYRPFAIGRKCRKMKQLRTEISITLHLHPPASSLIDTETASFGVFNSSFRCSDRQQ